MELSPPSIAGMRDVDPGLRLCPPERQQAGCTPSCLGCLRALELCGPLAPRWGFPSPPSSTQSHVRCPLGHPAPLCSAPPALLAVMLQTSGFPYTLLCAAPGSSSPLAPHCPLPVPPGSPGLGERSGEPREPSAGAQVAAETRHLLSHLRGPCRRCCIFRTRFLPPTCSPEQPFGFLTSRFSHLRLLCPSGCWRAPTPALRRGGRGLAWGFTDRWQ